jgi:ABC-type sugar transport system substrate-binding protein
VRLEQRQRICVDGGKASASTGGNASASGGGAGVKASGKLNGDGKLLVNFTVSSSDAYIGVENKAVVDEAERLGFKIKQIQNNFEQSQQDQQVQQYIASGQKPAAFLWHPADSEAGIADTRLLSRIAPVIQTNQRLLPAGDPYVKFYEGVNDFLIGKLTAQNLIDARAAAVKDGVKLHSKGGNVLVFGFPAGLQVGTDRVAGFKAALPKNDPFHVLGVVNSSTTDAQGSYTTAISAIPKYKSQGIDFVVAFNNDVLDGVEKALTQNGYQPGKNVFLTGGNCSGDLAPMKSGQIYGSVTQSPIVEGKLLVDLTAAYLATGKVQSGSKVYPALPGGAPTPSLTPPYRYSFMPATQLIGPGSLTKPDTWGMNALTACGNP